MDLLEGVNLVTKDGAIVSFDDIKAKNRFVGIYFSAHWCPPCREFTPVLANVYKELRNANRMFEVIFVSHDRTQEDMQKYMNECHADWAAVSKDDTAVTTALEKRFKLESIPRLIILRTSDGKVLIEDASDDVDSVGTNVWSSWCNQDC